YFVKRKLMEGLKREGSGAADVQAVWQALLAERPYIRPQKAAPEKAVKGRVMRNSSTTSRAIGRRSLLLSSAAIVASPAIVRAEAPWPAKPIRFIVPFGPGGSTDISMRILAPKLNEMLGQTCIVENRAGAGGVVGTDSVTKAAPDGYTLGHCTVSQVVIAPALYEPLPFAPEKDLTAISPTVFVPMCLSVTRKGLKVNSVQELVAE